MNLIAVADMHLKMVPGVPKDWQISRYKSFIEDLISDCREERAALAICGDTLDSIDPKKEEINLFMYLMHRLYKEDILTFLVSGNHETIKKGESILDYLEVSQFPNVYYRTNATIGDVTFHLVNHDSIHTYQPKFESNINVLLSHFRCTIPPHIREEIDVKKFTEGYDLVIAGDIHSEIAFDNVYYTSIPINKEFQDTPVCGCLAVSIVKGQCAVVNRKLNYPKLLKRCLSVEDFKTHKFDPTHYYKVEVKGEPDLLRTIKDIPSNVILIRVPVLQQAYSDDVAPEAQLSESTDSVEEDLVQYLKALKYDDSKIAAMIGELRRG